MNPTHLTLVLFQEQIAHAKVGKLYTPSVQDVLNTSFQSNIKPVKYRMPKRINLSSSSESDDEPATRIKVVAQIHSMPREIHKPLKHKKLRNIEKTVSNISNFDVKDDTIEVSKR